MVAAAADTVSEGTAGEAAIGMVAATADTVSECTGEAAVVVDMGSAGMASAELAEASAPICLQSAPYYVNAMVVAHINRVLLCAVGFLNFMRSTRQKKILCFFGWDF